MKKCLLLTFGGLLCLLAINTTCLASNLQGRVINYITNTPAKNLKVVAVTNTDIIEEQKYAKLTATTDNNGVFKITKALKSKRYKLYIDSKNYISTSIYSRSPEKNVTRAIKENIYVAKLPKINRLGFFVYPDMKQILPKDESGYTNLRPFEIPKISGQEVMLAFLSPKNNSPHSSFQRVSLDYNKNYYSRGISIRSESKRFEKNGIYVTIFKVSLSPGIYSVHDESHYNYYYYLNVVSNDFLTLEEKAKNSLDRFWALCNNSDYSGAVSLLSSSYISTIVEPLGGLEAIYKHLLSTGFEKITKTDISLVEHKDNKLIGYWRADSTPSIARKIHFMLDNKKPKIDYLGIEGWPGLVIGKSNILYENSFQTESEIKSAENWSNVNSKHADYKIENNAYIINAKADNDYIWAFDGSKEYRNYSYSADLSRPGRDANYYGLLFDYIHPRRKESGRTSCTPTGHFFYFNNNGQYELDYECGRSGGLHKQIYGYSPAISNSGVNKIRVDHVGDIITLFINGDKILNAAAKDIYHASFDYGNIGVYGRKGINKFDNIKVISLDEMAYRANQEDTQRPLMPQQIYVNLTSLLSANNPLNGEASGRKDKWPFILRVTKLNKLSGKISGQIEFTTLSSTIKIEGMLSNPHYS
jgi:hypothetical protein